MVLVGCPAHALGLVWGGSLAKKTPELTVGSVISSLFINDLQKAFLKNLNETAEPGLFSC